MPSIPSRRLVIDACVAASCGGDETTYPTGKNCRDFLTAVLETGHRAVMTPAIADEWNRHQHHYARRWRRRMVARRRLEFAEVNEDQHLRRRLRRLAASEEQRSEIDKDCHLVEAARATDHTIASLDETMRRILARTSATVVELRTTVWVNPDKADEDPISWLQAGAHPERQRCLGFRPAPNV